MTVGNAPGDVEANDIIGFPGVVADQADYQHAEAKQNDHPASQWKRGGPGSGEHNLLWWWAK